MFGVYGVRREKFFSRINSHVIDVLKVDRRGDQTGVTVRGRIQEAWLSKQPEGEKGDKVMKWIHWLQVTFQTTCMEGKMK